MTLANPLGLLWLLAVPAVVLLHLFRRRLRERRVAGLFLFAGERLAADAGRTRTRLLQTPSLWLECLAAALLASWLCGLSFVGAPPRHVVFVLDDSASMQAGGAAKAIAVVREQAAALRGGDRVTLLRTGPRPEVLLGPAAPPADVGAALAGYAPLRARHDPLPAIDLAREIAAGAGEVVYVTDEAPPPGCADVTVLAFGEAAANCAILTALRLPREDGEELRVRIAGHGAVAATTLTVFAGDSALPRGAVALPGGAVELHRAAVELHDGLADVDLMLPAGVDVLRIELDHDALAVDDVAWLLPAPERTVAVSDLLPAERRQQLQLGRVFQALSGCRVESDPRSAQLVIAAKPGPLRPGQTEVVVVPGDGERAAFRGPFAIDRGHAWLSSVQLQGVVWCAGPASLPGRVLVATGPEALLTEEALDEGTRLWLRLDAAAGNLVRSPDWPVLWSNLVDAARLEVPGAEEPNVLLGEEARYRRTLQAGAGDTTVSLEAPDGTRSPGRGARVVGFVPASPGVHRVLGEGDRELARFAARFCDPSESDLRSLTTGVWPRTAPPATETPSEANVEQRLLALLVLAFVLADWWLLARRGP